MLTFLKLGCICRQTVVNYDAVFPYLEERGMYMKCKNCGTEIQEGVAICPQCGKAAEKGDSSRILKIVMGAVGALVIVAVLVCAVLYGMGINFLPRENDIYYKDSYTAKTEVLKENLDTVVATIGGAELTCGELQLYYWQEVFSFLSEYGSLLDSIGLDLSKPFDKQIFDEKTEMSFQQVFLQMALERWTQSTILMLLAEEDNFQLTEQQQKDMDGLKETIENMAKEAGYTDMEKFVDEKLVPGSSFQSYLAFNEVGFMASAYNEKLYNDLLPTTEEIAAYYQENEAALVEKGFGKDAGLYYDVRHILIAVEGERDEAGNVTYTDANWEACLNKAQEILDKFLAGEYEGGTTEDVFATLAKNNSVDTGSKNNGGLYSQLTKNTNFIEDFKNWYLDESRQPGDTGLVKNTQSSIQGYHIMYFSGTRPIWEVEAEAKLVALIPDQISALFDAAVERWPLEIDFTKVMLGHMDLV